MNLLLLLLTITNYTEIIENLTVVAMFFSALFFAPCAALNEVGIEDLIWGTILMKTSLLVLFTYLQTQAFVIMIT